MPSESYSDVKFEIGHVLFIDIVGYSKLLIKEQSERIQKLKEIVRSTEQFRLAEAEGKLLRLPTGDGGALVFRTSPEAPVLCAVEISKALKDHPELQVRMGIHSGPVNEVTDLNEQANIAGAGINIAQRVMDCGDAGHILLSRHVAEDLEQYERWQAHLDDLGTCEVKHGLTIGVTNLYSNEVGNPRLPRKFAVQRKQSARKRWGAFAAVLIVLGLTIGASVLVSYRSRPGAAAIPEKSIAVLPFENLSSDQENAYFADGIQDEILTRISKIADLKVISRTSTQHYKSAPTNLPEIARQLGVAHILEGSVQKVGNAVHVSVQLIRASNDAHIWAESYNRKLDDVFGVEGEVATTIAEQLNARLSGIEQKVVADKPTENVAAYDAYLRGLAYKLKSKGAPDYVFAQKYLREAVRLDPKFALAWAVLSQIDARGYLTTNLEPTIALRDEARQAAETALSLQPNLGEALMAKGEYYYGCLRDLDTAERYFLQARQMLPNSSLLPEALALVERRRGHSERSIAYFREAERLDPRNVSMLTQWAAYYVVLRQFPEALRRFDQILDITPDDLDIIVVKAGIAQAEGDLLRASSILAPLRLSADNPAALETQVYQGILERHPMEMISRLKEVLAKPDPALGYFVGELRFWLGWSQEVAGDETGAQESWRQARNELEPLLETQPANMALMVDLALIHMGLGNKDSALAMAERAMAADPLEKDAMDGTVPIEVLARVAARVHEPDRSITILQKLLSIPGEGALASGTVGRPLTPALLRLDPMFDPLRNDQRFQKLIADTEPVRPNK